MSKRFKYRKLIIAMRFPWIFPLRISGYLMFCISVRFVLAVIYMQNLSHRKICWLNSILGVFSYIYFVGIKWAWFTICVVVSHDQELRIGVGGRLGRRLQAINHSTGTLLLQWEPIWEPLNVAQWGEREYDVINCWDLTTCEKGTGETKRAYLIRNTNSFSFVSRSTYLCAQIFTLKQMEQNKPFRFGKCACIQKVSFSAGNKSNIKSS